MSYLNPIVLSAKTENKMHILEGCQLQYGSLYINMPVLDTLTTKQHKVIVYYSQSTQTLSLIESKKTQDIPRISLTFPQFSASNDEEIYVQLKANLTKDGLELKGCSLTGKTSTVFSDSKQIINKNVNTSNTILDTSNK